jgi:hypothetical protein
VVLIQLQRAAGLEALQALRQPTKRPWRLCQGLYSGDARLKRWASVVSGGAPREALAQSGQPVDLGVEGGEPARGVHAFTCLG